MSVIRKDLGMVTAYAYAVSKGYTGTEEQFATLMASYADVGQTAVDAALAAKASEDAAKASETASAASQAAATSAWNAQTAAETAQTAAETAQGAAEDAAESVSASAAQIAQNTADISDIQGHLGQIDATLIVNEASGAIATFPDGADGVPMRSVTVDMEPIQDLHGQSSPYPPGGGTNVLPTYTENVTSKGIRMTVNIDGSVTLNGTSTGTVTLYAPESTFMWDGTSPYWLSGCPSGGNYESGYSLRVDGNNYWSKVDTGDGCALAAYNDGDSLTNVPLKFCIVVRSGTVCNNITFKPMLNAGTSASTFAPYSNICPISGRSEVGVWREATYDTSADPALTIPLGQTVYGGVLDVTSGTLTVDMAMVDLGALTWTYSEVYYNFIGDLSGAKRPANVTDIPNILCSQYAAANGIDANNTSKNNIVTLSASYERVIVRDSRYTNAASFKTAMSGVQLCYELAQPVTVQLDPKLLRSLYGINNVWSDADSVDVDYVADLKTYIAKVIAAALA